MKKFIEAVVNYSEYLSEPYTFGGIAFAWSGLAVMIFMLCIFRF